MSFSDHGKAFELTMMFFPFQNVFFFFLLMKKRLRSCRRFGILSRSDDSSDRDKIPGPENCCVEEPKEDIKRTITLTLPSTPSLQQNTAPYS